MSTSSSPIVCPEPLREHLLTQPVEIIVTGAGGWLGRATLEMLDDAFGEDLPRRLRAYASSKRELRLRSGRVVHLAPLTDLAYLEPSPHKIVIAHYAFLTREKASQDTLEGYIARNRGIIDLVTTQARRLNVVGTFSTSSGAVYRPDRSLDDDLEGNPYGVLKLEEEKAFGQLARETGCSSAVCRVFNLSGPFINKEYALSSFLAAVRDGGPIVIRANRPVLRSYAHVGDVVAIGLACMSGLIQAPEEPYDTAGAEAVEVGELAERIRRVVGRPDVVIRRDEFIDRPAEGHRYIGDGTTFTALAAAMGLRPAPLDRQISDTAAFLFTA